MVKEELATEPVPPVFPHAPQVNQLGESSTLFRTVVLAGEPEGVGEGEGDGAGAGVGVGDALAMGVPPLVDEVFPPQPLIPSKTTRTANDNDIQLRTLTPPVFGKEPCAECTKRTKNLDYEENPSQILRLGWTGMGHNPPAPRTRRTMRGAITGKLSPARQVGYKPEHAGSGVRKMCMEPMPAPPATGMLQTKVTWYLSTTFVKIFALTRATCLNSEVSW